MKLVLIGYMASGKTSIGKKLAKKINISFIDLDEYIVEHEEMSISTIFKTKGEVYFRKIETQYLEELINTDKDFVLALGGGTPCYGNNLNVILNNSISIYLKYSLQTAYNKLSKESIKHKRPLIASISNDDLKEFIAKHLFERIPFYEQANYTIRIDNKKKKEIVNEIIKLNKSS